MSVRRRVRNDIQVRAEQISIAVSHSAVVLDKPAAVALLVLGVELLEEKHTRAELLVFFEQILDAPLPLDPRRDTRGT